MNGQNTSKLEKYTPLPHQAAFIEQFLADSSKRGYLLQSDVGLGTSYTTALIIKRSIEAQPGARILLLVPKALQMQMSHVLASVGVIAEVVDRFRYRELQDAAPYGGTVWQMGRAFILSLDFGKQEDIASSLAAVQWTQLVVSEAHLLRGLRRQVVQRIAESSPNLRIVLITLIGVNDIPTFGIEPFTMVQWRRSQVVDHFGQRLFVQPGTQLEIIEYQKEVIEQQIQEAVIEIANLLGTSSSVRSFLSAVLIRLMESSPAALEEGMRRFRTRLTDGVAKLVLPVDGEDEETDAENPPFISPENRERLIVALDKCLEALEVLRLDSKLNAFINTFLAPQDNRNASRPLCIITEFRATLFYLQTQLEEMGLPQYAIHGSMSFDERARNVSEFKQRGGILLSTFGMVEGLSLPLVELLVLYDSPRSMLAMRRLYGQFQRLGRTEPLRIQIFVDASAGTSDKSEVVSKLRALLDDEGNDDRAGQTNAGGT